MMIDIWIDISSRSPFPVQGGILRTVEGPDEQEKEEEKAGREGGREGFALPFPYS